MHAVLFTAKQRCARETNSQRSTMVGTNEWRKEVGGGGSNWQMTNAKQEVTWSKIMRWFIHRKSQLEDNLSMCMDAGSKRGRWWCALPPSLSCTQTSCLHVSWRICLFLHFHYQSYPQRNKRQWWHRLDPKPIHPHFPLFPPPPPPSNPSLLLSLLSNLPHPSYH